MRLSIIVPTRNSARSIERCLLSLRCQSGPPVEIVVVDNRSTDATVEIAGRHADIVMTGGPERSAQRNAGARAATGEVLLFVDDDMVLEPGVATEIDELTDAGADAIIVPERSFGDGFWARCKALEKLLVLDDASVEASRGFRRTTFMDVGGYDETLTACEDWDLADRVAGPTRTEPARTTSVIWHDEGHLRLSGTFAKKRYYGRWVDQWMTEAPEHRRNRSFSTLVPQLAAQPVTAAGVVVMKSVEMAGFALGMRDARKEQS